jgi:hypothetical protein
MAAVRSLRGRPLAIVGDFDPARPEATALREAGFIEAGASGEGPHHLWFSPALTDRSPRCCCWYDRGWPIADRAALVCDLDP